MADIIDHSLYNTLPSLEKAEAALEDASLHGFIEGRIRDVFLEHQVEETLCLYLQHAHHVIESKQAIVKVSGTGHLMDAQQMEGIISAGNMIVATTWMSTSTGLYPMELAVQPPASAASTPTPAFCSALLAVLLDYNCAGSFGIDTIASNRWAEINVGGASVVIPDYGIKAESQQEFIDVAFTFDSAKEGFTVHGRCGVDHRHATKPPK